MGVRDAPGTPIGLEPPCRRTLTLPPDLTLGCNTVPFVTGTRFPLRSSPGLLHIGPVTGPPVTCLPSRTLGSTEPTLRETGPRGDDFVPVDVENFHRVPDLTGTLLSVYVEDVLFDRERSPETYLWDLQSF